MESIVKVVSTEQGKEEKKEGEENVKKKEVNNTVPEPPAKKIKQKDDANNMEEVAQVDSNSSSDGWGLWNKDGKRIEDAASSKEEDKKASSNKKAELTEDSSVEQVDVDDAWVYEDSQQLEEF